MTMSYEFRVEGPMTDQAREAFCDMLIEEVPEGARLYGQVIDEAHLMGRHGAVPGAGSGRRLGEPDRRQQLVTVDRPAERTSDLSSTSPAPTSATRAALTSARPGGAPANRAAQ